MVKTCLLIGSILFAAIYIKVKLELRRIRLNREINEYNKGQRDHLPRITWLDELLYNSYYHRW